MGVLRSLALAFSCFSGIPVPQVEWSPENMRFMMACFPLVGVVAGAAVLAWWWACDAAGLGAVLRAAGVVLLPIAVSGGIHLDGLADVADAQASHAGPERKREILKDPHVGAFAVIGVATWLLAYVTVATELPVSWPAAVVLACVAVLVRCESGFATVVFAGASGGGAGAGAGMLASFRASAAARASVAAIVVEFVVAAAVAIAAAPVPGIAAVVAGLVCLAALRPFARRNFGGMSGDVAGAFLCVSELVMVAALAAAAKAVGL